MSYAEARYLLRFDDVSPTMLRSTFKRLMAVVERHGIRPILAVVPDNLDPELEVDDPDPAFWNRMRTLEAAGCAIALHGYRHLCKSAGRSLLGLHAQTEFAGVPEETQREWIRAGLAILSGNGLSPRLFVAPRHGFDAATLSALDKEGLRFISDGFAKRPFKRGGVVWIPQQLWGPVEKARGLWTICLHSNTAGPVMISELDRFLHEHGDRFTSFDEVVCGEDAGELGWVERIQEAFAVQRIRLRAV